MSHDPSRLDQSVASVQVSRRLVDVLLSRVIEAGVVLLWHGLWTIMDLLSDKEAWLGLSPAHSAWLSLGVGWAGGLVLLVMQVPVLLLHHLHKSRLLRCLFLISFCLFILFGAATSQLCVSINVSRCCQHYRQFPRSLVPPGSLLHPRV